MSLKKILKIIVAVVVFILLTCNLTSLWSKMRSWLLIYEWNDSDTVLPAERIMSFFLPWANSPLTITPSPQKCFLKSGSHWPQQQLNRLTEQLIYRNGWMIILQEYQPEAQVPPNWLIIPQRLSFSALTLMEQREVVGNWGQCQGSPALAWVSLRYQGSGWVRGQKSCHHP